MAEQTQPQQDDKRSDLLKLLVNEHWDSDSLVSPSKREITASPSATIPEVFKILCDNNLLAIPIVDPESGKPLCTVGVIDIVNHISHRFDVTNIKRSQKHTFDFFSLVIEKRDIEKQKVDIIKEIGELDPAVTLKNSEATLLQIIINMLAMRARRVVIVDNDTGRFLRLVSQTQIVQWLRHHLTLITVTRSKTVQELKLGLQKVPSILHTETADRAFRIMKEENLTGLAVVNENGTLCGNISCSDVKLLSSNLDFFQNLSFSVDEYLKQLFQYRLKIQTGDQVPTIVTNQVGGNRLPVVSVLLTDTFETVVSKMADFKVHRVYVVDDTSKPVGVISTFEILQQMMREVHEEQANLNKQSS